MAEVGETADTDPIMPPFDPTPADNLNEMDGTTAEETENTARRKNGILFRINYKIDSLMRGLFYRVGYFVATHPKRVMLATFIFTLVTLSGLARFRTESRGEKLWVPQGTRALEDQDYVEARYPDDTRRANIIFTRRGDGNDDNVATKERLLEMINVVEQGEEIAVGDNDYGARCERVQDEVGNEICLTISPLALFYNATTAEQREDGLVNFAASVRAVIEELPPEDVRNRLENGVGEDGFQNFNGIPFEREDYIANATGSGSNFKAEALLHRMFLVQNLTVVDGERLDNAADEWEERWTNTLLDANDEASEDLQWFVDSQFGQEDSFEQALTSDLPLLSGGFALLFLFLILFLGDFHSVRSRMICAIFGLITAGLALGTMFGLSSLFGMFYGPVHSLIPFLLLGIACDDIFIVTHGLKVLNREKKYAEKSTEQRIALALSEAGTAITVTSFTNTLVFLIGSITSLPSLRFFSLWAAIGIFFAWFYTITFYTAYLSIDQRRMDAGRIDCFPCKKTSKSKEKNWFGRRPGVFSRFMENYYAPFILHKFIAPVLLVLILALFAASCWGTSRLYLKFEFSFFYPDDSSQREFEDIRSKHFAENQPVAVYIRDIDYGSQENQEKLLELCRNDGVLDEAQFVDSGSVRCWYTELRQNLSIPDGEFIPSDTFTSEVQQFLGDGVGTFFQSDVQIRDGQIESSRVNARFVPLFSNDDEVDAMRSLRRTVNDAGFGDDAFAFSFGFIFFEQYAALPREIGLALGLAVVAVIIVSFLLIGSPVVALVAVLAVGMILIDILGFINFIGININTISVINLVLATGLSVDAVSHICRAFLEKIGDRKVRAIHALRDVGQPVFYAAFSTFLAIILLAGAKSYIFRVFFRVFVAIIVGGLIHGFLFVPIVLRYIGPRSFYATKEEKEDAVRRLEQSFVKPEAAADKNDVEVETPADPEQEV